MPETLLDIMMLAASGGLDDDLEEDHLPSRLEPIAVLERVHELLEQDLKNVAPENVADMMQDIEDCLHLKKNGLVVESLNPAPYIPPPVEQNEDVEIPF
jgi:hypothetical protein